MSGWNAKERQWRIVAIKKRDGFRCWLCGEKFGKGSVVTIDHAIPKARGGSNSLHNLRLAHEACNNERGCIVDAKPTAAKQRLMAMTPPSYNRAV
jgi:5-methylcytosine-specific restriction endonuclease McrA